MTLIKSATCDLCMTNLLVIASLNRWVEHFESSSLTHFKPTIWRLTRLTFPKCPICHDEKILDYFSALNNHLRSHSQYDVITAYVCLEIFGLDTITTRSLIKREVLLQ